MPDRTITARLFRYVRKNRNESYRVFAKALRVDHTTLYRYEKGNISPSGPVLTRLVQLSEAKDLNALIIEVFPFVKP